MDQRMIEFYRMLGEPVWSHLVSKYTEHVRLVPNTSGTVTFHSLILYPTTKKTANDPNVYYYVMFGMDYISKTLYAISTNIDEIFIHGDANVHQWNVGLGLQELYFKKRDGTDVLLKLKTPVVTTIADIDTTWGVMDI